MITRGELRDKDSTNEYVQRLYHAERFAIRTAPAVGRRGRRWKLRLLRRLIPIRANSTSKLAARHT